MQNKLWGGKPNASFWHVQDIIAQSQLEMTKKKQKVMELGEHNKATEKSGANRSNLQTRTNSSQRDAADIYQV